MKKSVPQHAAEVIQARIRSGLYPVGGPIPGQRLLAEELGVGRPANREAISALEGLGLLQAEPGRGVFVQNPKEIRAARWRFAAQYSLENVYVVRASLESLCAVLVTNLATASDIKCLERLTRKLKAAVKRDDLLAMASADREFHRSMAEMSKNPLLIEMLDACDTVVTEGRNLAFRDGSENQRNAPVIEHLQIIEAIRQRNAKIASQEMNDHIFKALGRTGVLTVLSY